MKTQKVILIVPIIICLISYQPVVAQSEDELVLKLSRDWGYGGFSNDIQGLFSMHADGPEDITRVAFFIDDQQIGEDSEPPYKIQFNTDNYTLGLHELSAIGYKDSGESLPSNTIRVEFVSASASGETMLRIVGPILAILVIVLGLSVAIPLIFDRGKKSLPLGAPRKYGLAGGAICNRCHRPFSMHLVSMNLIVGKLDRCPYCGKWGLVRSVSMSELKAAEANELLQSQPSSSDSGISDEEKLRKDLKDSRYQDS